MRRTTQGARIELPPIEAAEGADAFELQRAALEWTLHAPITIRGEQDIQSKKRWDSELKPYRHQVDNLITFCRRAPAALLADDVGLGKTISAGLIVAELMERKRVSRILVVAPKLLLPQWEEEMWTKFRINISAASGADVRTAMEKGNDGVVTTYHSASTYLEDLARADFDMIILDEAHKLRNLHGANKAPKMATAVRKALEQRWFNFVLMLTATPIQNRLWDIYSLLDLLTVAKGHPNPLGNPKDFKSYYINDSKGTELNPEWSEDFRQRLSEYVVRTRRADARLAFPDRIVKLEKVRPTSDELQLMEMVGELLESQSMNGLVQSSIGQALMSSPQALSDQLGRMLERGTVRGQEARAIRKFVEAGARTAKLDGLMSLVCKLIEERPDDWRVVLFTGRKDTQRMIGEHLQQAGVRVGHIRGGAPAANEKAIRSFRSEPPGINVLVSTDAGAEGVNLQVANVLVNYDLPWNPMLLEQRIGRIQRLASKHATITVLNLVLAGSVEETVVARLTRKLMAVADSIGDLEGILEATGGASGTQRDFEATIRDLVVESLRGMDVAKATRLAEESIEEARDLFNREREEVDRTLGQLDYLHGAGPKVPDIEPIEPSLEHPEFVRRALREDGAALSDQGDGVFRVDLPGQSPFRMTLTERRFDDEREEALGEGRPRAFVPGKPHFERLAQSWAERGGTLVNERRIRDVNELRELLRASIEEREGVVIQSVVIDEVEEGFQGVATLKASKSVAHDRLEKLIDQPIWSGPELELSAVESDEPLTGETFRASEEDSLDPREVEKAIDAEPDLKKFTDFYDARRQEEVDRIDELGEARAKHHKRLQEQLTPSHAARLVAVRGIRFARMKLTARILVDGEGPYDAPFQVTPGTLAEGTPKEMAPWFTCEESNRFGPESAAGTCSTTGKKVLKHLLESCGVSEHQALSRYFVSCSISERRVLESETFLCPVTGLPIAKDVARTCAVSGVHVSPAELVECELTGALVLPKHLATSQISGKRFREDEEEVSVLTQRKGHASEMREAEDPTGLIAVDEAGVSDMSQRVAARERLARSEAEPYRSGLADEIESCSISGLRALRDEVVTCPVTGHLGLPSLMERCEVTDELVHPDGLTRSAASGRRFRSDQSVSSVISDAIAHQSEMVVSVLPEGPILESEAGVSAVSGATAARERLLASELEPFRLGLPDELVTCRVSGRKVLSDEVVASPDGEGWAVASELVACAFTERMLLPSQIASSLVSGKSYDQAEEAVSEWSGRRGHRSEFVEADLPAGLIAIDEVGRSDHSQRIAAAEALEESAVDPGRRAFPDEMVHSSISGKACLPGEEVRCVITGAPMLPDEVKRCGFTGGALVPDQIETSSLSGKPFRKDEACTSVLSGIRGHQSEFVEACDPVGWIPASEAEKSAVSGRFASRDRLVESSGGSGRLGLRDELEPCAASGALLFPDELAVSAVSGMKVDARLLLKSAASDDRALEEELVRCEVGGELFLPQEIGTCAVSGKRVDMRLLVQGDLSDRSCLEEHLATCVASGRRALPDELVVCSVSGSLIAPFRSVKCSVTGRQAWIDKASVTSEGADFYIDDDESRSEMQSRKGTRDLVMVCPLNTREWLATRMKRCSLTRAIVHESLLKDGEIEALRSCLNGWPPEGSRKLGVRYVGELAVPREWTKGVKEILVWQADAEGAAVVVLERKALFGLGGTRVHGAIITRSGKGALVGAPVEGRRDASGWSAGK